MLKLTSINIPASDGYSLSSLVIEPIGKPQGVIQFHRGTLSPKEFYLPFCKFLAEQGFVVIAFDYRGMGGSRPEKLKGFQGSIIDWGRKDMTGVMDWIQQTYGNLPKFVVGHSLGAQLVGLMKNSKDLTAVLSIAGNYGSWKYYTGFNRYKSAFMWAAYFPIMLTSVGYLPLKPLGMGEDLPREASWNLWQWCYGRGALTGQLEKAGHKHFYNHVQCPIKALYMTDDNIASLKAMPVYHDDFAQSQMEIEVIDPEKIGVAKLGHYGFFKPQHEETLWTPAVEWLKQFCKKKAQQSTRSAAS